MAPLVNGIECAGEVVANGPPIGNAAPLPVGTRVLACASSLGRGIDGTHAEYVVVPRWGVVAVPMSGTDLSWRELAAIPMSFGTAAGSLDAMDCREGDTVLIRGGTSALGMAAISLAKHVMGCTVLATTRRTSAKARLHAAGADVVLVEPDVRCPYPGSGALSRRRRLRPRLRRRGDAEGDHALRSSQGGDVPDGGADAHSWLRPTAARRGPLLGQGGSLEVMRVDPRLKRVATHWTSAFPPNAAHWAGERGFRTALYQRAGTGGPGVGRAGRVFERDAFSGA